MNIHDFDDIRPFLPEELPSVFQTLLNDETLRQRFSQRAVRYVQKFQVPAVMQQWKTLFETLCQTA